MSAAEPVAGPGAGRRILVVEDEYLVASHLEMVLEDLGFAVVGPVATIPTRWRRSRARNWRR